MKVQDEGETCILCKQEHLIRRIEDIAFRQVTDRGYVHCRVAAPIQICTNCGFKTWGAGVEAALDEAVREEYAKLT